MRQFNISITQKALSDLEAIYNYIAFDLEAPLSAMRQYDNIAAGIQSLNKFPLRNKLLDCQPEHNMGIRMQIIDNYSIIYVVKPASVIILRVLYSKSDIISRLRNNK